MAKKKRNILKEEDSFDLTPMIDVVFLLLIYFMVTTDLTEEADMGLKLPVPAPPDLDVQPPEEHVVEILPSGEVKLNGATMDFNTRKMDGLVLTLKRLKTSADSTGIRTSVTIIADPASLHQRSIDVMNACAAAKIKLISFAAQ